jgi:hypothetical protein
MFEEYSGEKVKILLEILSPISLKSTNEIVITTKENDINGFPDFLLLFL